LAKIILICGKICSGKTTYAKNIMEENKAVLLSVDEITLSLFGQHLGYKHDEIAEKTEKYLYKKSVEIISLGINVIFDWGFWKKSQRKYATEYFGNLRIEIEWHYIEVNNKIWGEYVQKRNNDVENSKENNYFIDENIAKKFWNIFEEPQKDEINIWYKNNEKIS
jgi:predicted kinase